MDLDRLFREHHAALFRYLTRLTGEPDLAEDAAQEAFARLTERPPRDDVHVRAWLFQVATNVVRDGQRSRRRRLALVEERRDRVPMADPSPSPAVAVEREELRAQVRRVLEQMSERDRTILLMREEGFSHAEIAQVVGTTTKSVGTLIARALNRVAKLINLDREDLA